MIEVFTFLLFLQSQWNVLKLSINTETFIYTLERPKWLNEQTKKLIATTNVYTSIYVFLTMISNI